MIKTNKDGNLMSIILGGTEFLFNGMGPKIYSKNKSELKMSVTPCEKDDYMVLHIKIENDTDNIIYPEKISLYLGIDCNMSSYPSWNNKTFPTMLRCEKTHFYGYFMRPDGNILGVASPDPFPSYSLMYENKQSIVSSVELDVINVKSKNPRCTECVQSILPHTSIERDVFLYRVNNLNEVEEISNKYTNAFIAKAKKYTLELGERIVIETENNVEVSVLTPSKQLIKNGDKAIEYGIYTVECRKSNKVRNIYIYCRKDWSFYLDEARNQAIEIPQKATTHCESWYGLFSGFLAAKHFPDKEKDDLIEKKFCEIMPYLFDFKNGIPKIAPYRIQNVSTAISLLVDRYEANPEKYFNSLEWANKLADYLIESQCIDGGYYQQGKTLFTCVIYVAKSMMELYLSEKNINEYSERAQKHFVSAKKAVDNLVDRLDNISTEGGNFFEDGMIVCSSMQIALFALITDDNKEKYISAAVCMMDKHKCLEQKIIPDCRMRNGSLRYWESQYDILTRPNMMSSPHGWTAWTLYGKYYLYLLTGKTEYLTDLMDGIGACSQLMTIDGKLRWGFVCDPCIDASVFIPDKKLNNGYSGKYVDMVIGEEYMDMISGWFCHEKQVPTCGHQNSALLDIDDNQGGCCDNDVHEIFKCMEETVLEKAFIHESDSGEILCYSCKFNDNNVVTDENVKQLICYFRDDKDIFINNKLFSVKGGKVNFFYCNKDNNEPGDIKCILGIQTKINTKA